MQLLMISEAERARVADILKYSRQPGHWYRCQPGGKTDQPPPGDNPAHVAYFGSYKIVFSYTWQEHEQKLWRHLSISDAHRWPHPCACGMLADLFGFKGWMGHEGSFTFPDSWKVQVDEEHAVITIVQQIDPLEVVETTRVS